MSKKDFDAVVVGSGPNGLSAAITLQREGLSVLLIEGKNVIGGGLRSTELTLPGFTHDICSAIHPLAAASPFFKTLPLKAHGLDWIYPEIAAAHPFEGGSAAVLKRSPEETAALLGRDRTAYMHLMKPVLESWPQIENAVLGPLSISRHTLDLIRFGLKALPSALTLSRRFSSREAKGLWAGMAAHSIQPLNRLSTSAVAIVLLTAGHLAGWPVASGGSGSVARALGSYFKSLGGTIETGFYVKSLGQLPSSRAILFDVTPRQLLEIAGHRFSSIYKWQLERYRYGMGVFKIDWALDAQIPFFATECRSAGTVHIGNTMEEIVQSERMASLGKIPDKPFVLLAQQTIFDPSRAPEGKHTAWAYCHVPNGSTVDMTAAIEKQIERFAPGFRERILARHVFNTQQLEEYNPNYIGGDINGGAMNIRQIFTRPVISRTPYNTSAKGLYICSSSTPPGGGVHGMCGYHAAKKALKEVFNLKAAPLYPSFEKQL